LNQRIDRCTIISNSSHAFALMGFALMPTPSILVPTWDNGLFSVTGEMVHQELADQSVRSLVADGRRGVLAIVGGHSLCRRFSDDEWTAIAKSEFELSCCVAIGNVVFVGTDDAHILRVDPDGTQQCLTGEPAGLGARASASMLPGSKWPRFCPWKNEVSI
jgi:hypothetical protein